MAGFIYGALIALNGLFSSPDKGVMAEMSSRYTDPVKPGMDQVCDDMPSSFYRLEDNCGHEGVVVDVTYRPEAGVDDNVIIYSQSSQELRDTMHLGRRHLSGLRSKIIDRVVNEDGTVTASVLNYFGNPKNFHYSWSDIRTLREFAETLQDFEK